MQEIVGNMWDIEADAYCVTTNMMTRRDGSLVMGGGVAKQAADRYPNLPTLWGAEYAVFMNLTPEQKKAFHLIRSDLMPDGKVVVAYPTKYDWKDPSDLILVMNSARDLATTADEAGWEKVIIPQPGCGLGGLDWAKVKPVIEPFLDDRFYIITPK